MDLPDGVMTDGDQATKLKELTAQATSKYSVKDYNAAAELYAYATELQAEINGEMSSQNADLLYSYGRCLYHVAIKKSDVLGQNLPGETSDNGSKGSRKEQKRKRAEGMKGDPERTVAEEFVTQIVEEKEALVKPKEESENGNKPLFQFTGDENFDDSRDEEDEVEEEADEEEADDEDDFVMAYEVLDIARVLLQKKVTEVEDASGKGKGKGEPQEVRQLKERLADTYDLQAEISLEGEKFSIAVIDLKSALELKEALYEHEHSHIAEAHYKLSLALEFSSVTQQKDENGETQETRVDEEMREEAAQELEAAISSCKLRIQKEEAKLKSFSQVNGEDGKPKVTKEDIEEVKDMIKELQQRVGLPGRSIRTDLLLRLNSLSTFVNLQYRSKTNRLWGL